MQLKKLLLFFVLILAFTSNAQSEAPVNLQWKLSENDSISYKTVMEPFAEDTATSDSLFKGLMKSMATMNRGNSYRTVLNPNKKNASVIDIAMYMLADKDTLGSGINDFAKLFADREQKQDTKKGKRKDRKKKEKEKAEVVPDSLIMKSMFKSLAGLNNNVVLRGRISKSGEVVSTYYKNGQVNLIAILFELPNKAIKIGDSWKLNLHLIEMDQNFVADSVAATNKVYLEKIEQIGNKKIAVLKYDISEYVSGDFNNPLEGMLGEKTGGKIFMKISHTATGRFSITDGRWETYEGVMQTESNIGFLSGKSGTNFKLEL